MISLSLMKEIDKEMLKRCVFIEEYGPCRKKACENTEFY